MIAEAKAKRDLAGIYTILLDEWGNIDRNNDVIDFWPCRDLALEALGIFLDDKWDN
jgi:hypothetical protein